MPTWFTASKSTLHKAEWLRSCCRRWGISGLKAHMWSLHHRKWRTNTDKTSTKNQTSEFYETLSPRGGTTETSKKLPIPAGPVRSRGILRSKAPRTMDMHWQGSREASSSSRLERNNLEVKERELPEGVGNTSNSTEKNTDKQEDPRRPWAPHTGWFSNKSEQVITYWEHTRDELQRFFFFKNH